jgi:hypothetical protein
LEFNNDTGSNNVAVKLLTGTLVLVYTEAIKLFFPAKAQITLLIDLKDSKRKKEA